MSRHRSWILTLWQEPDEGAIAKCDYFLAGEEICPNTGKKHWQSYAKFANARTFNQVKLIFGKDVHLEAAKGSFDDNFIYCTKDGKYKEYGIRPKQGKRNDLITMKKQVLDEKKTLTDIVHESVENYQQLRFVEGLMKYVKPYSGERKVIYIWGKTGVGKSRYVRERCSENLENVSFINTFYLGYKGSKEVVFDDFRGEMPFRELLKITDRYAYNINVKGGEMPWNAETIFITSDRAPDKLYSGVGDISQFLRRITAIIFLTNTDTDTEVNG